MQKIAGGRGIGSSSVVCASLWDVPVAGVRSPEAIRSSTVPCVNATIVVAAHLAGLGAVRGAGMSRISLV